MVFYILYALTIALEFVCVPLFLKYYWPEKCAKSMMYKVISASLFVLCGIFAMKASGNNTPYATLIIWGLVFGLIGDVLLHWLKPNPAIYAGGVVAFLVGHIFYLIAIQKAILKTYPKAKAIEWYEVLIVLAVLAVVLTVAIVKNVFKGRELMITGGFLYGIILIFMLSKAARYAFGEWAYGTNDNVLWVFLTIFVGAILFVVSDLLLGYIIGFKKHNRKVRIINIVTYFTAQILIASSILVVQSAYPLY